MRLLLPFHQLLATISVAVCLTVTAAAQEIKRMGYEDPWWVDAGIGPLWGNQTMVGGSAELSWEMMWSGTMLSLRIAAGEEFRICVWGDCLRDDVLEASLLYGLAWSTDHGHASVSAGIGLARGNIVTNDAAYRTFSTVGVPIEARAFYIPFSFAGIGVSGFVNINSGQIFGGALVCLRFGRLRND